MNKSRLLVMLVVADVLLAFASVGSEAFFGWTLPPALAEFTRLEFTGRPDAGDAIPLLLLGTTTLCTFGAWVGLLTYWRHARRLYLFSCASCVLLVLFSGPSVMPSVSAMFRLMNGLVSGSIIGLVYFSDLAHRFERAPVHEIVTQSPVRAPV